MAAAASFQAAFSGLVQQPEYTQIHDFEYSGSVRSLVTRCVKEQTFIFTGLAKANAMTTTSQTVTDIEGTSYTVPMECSVTDSSSGTKVFETESVKVDRRRISPHLWKVVVHRVGSQYYHNGTLYVSGPSWAFPTT